jgi:hypothetical protein
MDAISTYGTSWNFVNNMPPIFSTTANAKDVLAFFCDSPTFCMIGNISTAFGH